MEFECVYCPVLVGLGVESGIDSRATSAVLRDLVQAH